MKLTIIGASGHGRVIADIAEKRGYSEIEFLDDNPETRCCGRYPVVGPTTQTKGIQNDIFVAIGNNAIRSRIMGRLLGEGHRIPTLIHPNAIVANDVGIGEGTAIMAGVVVNPNVQIGRGCIVNTCSSIDHDCQIGDYVHVAVGAHLCGAVAIGDNTTIGAGATVINNLSVCAECIVGAGATVIDTIVKAGTYIGIPAKNKQAR